MSVNDIKIYTFDQYMFDSL